MSETAPPSPPTNSGKPLIALIIAMLVVGGGIAFWKIGGSSDELSDAEASVEAPPTEEEDEVQAAPPPPPPPPPKETAEPEPEATAKKTAVASGKKFSGSGGCNSPCNGKADSQFSATLRQRAGLARTCYNQGLRQNANLEGRMNVRVRVAPSGQLCSATATDNSLGDASVTSCILQKFRSGSWPKPRGGCVEGQVPLNFVTKQ